MYKCKLDNYLVDEAAIGLVVPSGDCGLLGVAAPGALYGIPHDMVMERAARSFAD